MLTPPQSVTGFQPGFGTVANGQLSGGVNSYQLLPNAPTAILDGVSRVMSRQSVRDVAAVMVALLGVAAGSNATATFRRVQQRYTAGVLPDLGGLVPIEVETRINRNTTAADVTLLTSMLNRYTGSQITYAPDLSGNGGAHSPTTGI